MFDQIDIRKVQVSMIARKGRPERLLRVIIEMIIPMPGGSYFFIGSESGAG